MIFGGGLAVGIMPEGRRPRLKPMTVGQEGSTSSSPMCIHGGPSLVAEMNAVTEGQGGRRASFWCRPGRVAQDRPACTGPPASAHGSDLVRPSAARRRMIRAAGVRGRTVVTRRERGTDTYSLPIRPPICAVWPL
jgi:hypothetical protein